MKVKLSDLKLGEEGKVLYLNNDGMIRRRLLDMGFVKGEKVMKVLESPLKDPTAYKVLNAIVALRNEDGKKIIVEVKR